MLLSGNEFAVFFNGEHLWTTKGVSHFNASVDQFAFVSVVGKNFAKLKYKTFIVNTLRSGSFHRGNVLQRRNAQQHVTFCRCLAHTLHIARQDQLKLIVVIFTCYLSLPFASVHNGDVVRGNEGGDSSKKAALC